MAIAGKIGAFYTTVGATPTTFTDEAMETVDSYFTYKITDEDKKFFNTDVTVVVSVDSGVVASSGYTVQYAGGRIIFDVALTSGNSVTITGSYLPVVQSTGCYNWKLDTEIDTSEVTTFANNGNKTYITNVKGFTLSAEAFWVDENFLTNLGEKFGAILYVDEDTDVRYECYAQAAKDSIECPVGEIVTETIELTGEGQVYYRND